MKHKKRNKDYSTQSQSFYQNSHSAKPLLYKITGVWGNHEGSMLLWLLVLVFFGFIISKFDKRLDLPYKTLTLSFPSGCAWTVIPRIIIPVRALNIVITFVSVYLS